jgi:hypothetical protein
MTAIEETHYVGEANADFEVLLGPVPLAPGVMAQGMACAHKRRMSGDALIALLGDPEIPGLAEEVRRGQDVLLVVEVDD